MPRKVRIVSFANDVTITTMGKRLKEKEISVPNKNICYRMNGVKL